MIRTRRLLALLLTLVLVLSLAPAAQAAPPQEACREGGEHQVVTGSFRFDFQCTFRGVASRSRADDTADTAQDQNQTQAEITK